MKHLLAFTFLIFSGIGLNAQLKFEHLTTKEGLSTDRAGTILRDSRGYLWIGSEAGLDKYDGYKIKTYRHNDKQSGTISNNDIWEIFEDHTKNIWFATPDGLNLYCPESDSFIVFRNNPADINSIDHNRIFAFCDDSKGNLWISTQGNCLNKWDPTRKNFIRYPIKNSSGFLFMEEDSKGNLWLVSKGLPGIYRFDPKTGNLTTYIDATIDLTKKYKELYIDKDDKIWITPRNEGLFSFDPSTGKFKQFNSNGDGKGTNGKIINNIVEKDNRHLWIGVDQGGINCFDKVSQTFEYIMYNDKNEDGLSNNGIWEIFKDNEGIIWVGTSGGGINSYNPKKNKFKLFRHHSNNPNSVSSNIIGCLHEDSQGMIWIGTDNNGLDEFNPKTGSFKSFKHNTANPFSISSNTIRCIGEDENKNLWIGTWNKGFNRFDRKTGRFYCYMPDANNPASLSGPTVWHYIIDHKGIFWLAIHDVGIDLFDKKRGVIKRFVPDSNNPKALSNAKVWYIYEDSNRNIWLCTNNGLNLYDSKNNSFKVYKHFPSQNIKVITEDRDKKLWIGTEKGICQLKADGTIRQAYDETNGLASNNVHGIVCDNSGNLWVSTNNGISKFDPKTKIFKNFTEKEGLQDNAFFQESFLKTRKGEIYFGGFNGFNSFFPDSIKVNTAVPPVYITEFQIFNKPVALGVPGSPLKKQISETNEITLTHSQSVFSFGFTAINYTNPEKNRYAYKMEGFEKEWNYTDANRRYVTYTNLDPGEYTFRVKASNNDGIWNEKGTSLKITIIPPWWGTWWFRGAIMVALLALAFTIHRLQVMNIKRYNLKLKGEVAERTGELDAANEELQATNEELETANESFQTVNSKLATANNELESFAYSVSHDLRAPLRSIDGFSLLLLEDYQDKVDATGKDYLQRIRTATIRMTQLIDDLLNLSHISRSEMNIQQINLSSLVKEIADNLMATQPERPVKFSIQEGVKVQADSRLLRIVLENLIGNAWKFTSKHSTALIEFGVRQQNELPVYFIHDDGAGFDMNYAQKLFGAFQRLHTLNEFPGTGIGLATVQRIIHRHGGKVWAEGKVNDGATFYFQFPKYYGKQLRKKTVSNLGL